MAIVIIGSGNWGSTLVGLINPAEPVRLWCESADLIEPARQALTKIAGASRVRTTIEPAFATPVTGDDIVVVVVPSSQVAHVAGQIREHCQPAYPAIVTASKGLERNTLRTMSQVISAIIPEATVAVLSGPTIAREIADGRPAKLVLGCDNVHILLRLAQSLASDRMYLDMTRDTVNVELCAAMKGVFAIGAGVIAGRGMGCNDMGLLLTYGIKEMSNLARFMGMSTDHVFGIAGLGDLVATCFSPDSRNYRLGKLLAAKVPLKEAAARVQMTVEGAMTAAAVSEMAALRIQVPLFSAIAGVVGTPSDETLRQFEQTLFDYPGGV